jgi:hypothetical protein
MICPDTAVGKNFLRGKTIPALALQKKERTDERRKFGVFPTNAQSYSRIAIGLSGEF